MGKSRSAVVRKRAKKGVTAWYVYRLGQVACAIAAQVVSKGNDGVSRAITTGRIIGDDGICQRQCAGGNVDAAAPCRRVAADSHAGKGRDAGIVVDTTAYRDVD